MKHKVKKAKFGLGKDANDALFKKMCYNFFTNGTLTTTSERAKAVKALIDSLVSKTSEKTESNKNYILRYVQDKKIIDSLFEKAGPVAQKVRGGYVSMKRLHIRTSDGAQMAKLEWANGITLEPAKEEAPAPKTKKATKAPKAQETDTNTSSK